MNKNLTHQIIHIILTLLGVAVIIIGIITGKNGAIVIGIIVMGINAQQWLQWKKNLRTD